MARKFLQMGMTRAKRYANHKGGRKYASGGRGSGKVLDGDVDGWKGSEGWKEKEEASRIFKEVWEKAKASNGYQMKNADFLKRQKQWDKQKKAESGEVSSKR